MNDSVPIFTYVFLALALVVLPLAFLGGLIWLNFTKVAQPPRFELFVAFGTLGGWLLTFALSPSPLSLPCFAFSFFVLIPASVCLILRMAARPAPVSAPHKFAFWALLCGISTPVIVVGLSLVFTGQ